MKFYRKIIILILISGLLTSVYPSILSVIAAGMVGNFSGRGAVGFRTISLAPHQTACLDVTLLNDDEIRYLNSYHARVLATLGPILKERKLNADYDWLEKECAPIRSAAMFVATSPFLIISVVYSLWCGA